MKPAKKSNSVQFKQPKDLTEAEIKEINALVPTEWQDPKDNLSQENPGIKHLETLGMIRMGDVLVATCGFRMDMLHTPFAHRKLPVIFAGMTLQHPSPLLLPAYDPFESISLAYIREMLGPAWPLQNTVHIGITMNPKRIEKYHRRTNSISPSLDGSSIPGVGEFIQSYIWDLLEIDHPLVSEHLLTLEHGPVDVSKQWQSAFESSKMEFNKHCFDLEIFRKEENRILLTGRRAILCAHHSPSNNLRSLLNRY